MAIQKYRPYSLLDELQREMNTLFQRPETESSFDSQEWSPAVDISEDEDKFTIHADLPGVKSDEIEITADNGVLTIKGQRDNLKEENKDSYRRIERFSGSFIRRFTLPERADLDNIAANSRNGVLELIIPKTAESRPRRIEVKVEH